MSIHRESIHTIMNEALYNKYYLKQLQGARGAIDPRTTGGRTRQSNIIQLIYINSRSKSVEWFNIVTLSNNTNIPHY